MPKGFFFLLAAQFASGFADHALLIVGIRFLQEQGFAPWWAPVLKLAFTTAYVVLAPLLGPVADALPKARLMSWMNVLKVTGVLALLLGAHPALAFALIGLAAAAYAPAKYGWVIDAVHARQLVRANAWLEVSVILSVVGGIAAGGALLGLAWPSARTLALPYWLSALQVVPTGLGPAFGAVLMVYALAALLNLCIPHAPARHACGTTFCRHWGWAVFFQGQRRLWRDPVGRVSLQMTTLFWGVGAVLQFAVLVWAEQQLRLTLAQGAYLQALVAVGVVMGAALAGRLYRLQAATRVLPLGLWLALLLPLLPWIESLWLALPLLLLTGALAGLLLVPMNALLQYRGAQLLSSGRSVAVQGFNENASVLVMLSFYSLGLAMGLPLWSLMLVLSGLLLTGTWPLCRLRWRKR